MHSFLFYCRASLVSNYWEAVGMENKQERASSTFRPSLSLLGKWLCDHGSPRRSGFSPPSRPNNAALGQSCSMVIRRHNFTEPGAI
jgi:hypothetical protein